MKKDIVIKLQNVSKNYKIYDSARDRVKEAFSITRKKYYKDFCALKDVNLEIKKGEVLGLFGLNGAGKSTLLKMIAGVVTPSSGRINVRGNINAMLELGGNINPELTGMQNIMFSLDLNKIEGSERDETIKQITDFADIGDYIYQPVKSYSSGMAARLGFGISTAVKPDILIVDEVLAVGDAIFQNKCFIKIKQLLKGGTTVIFVSHNISLMLEFCTRAVFIHERGLLLDGDPKQVAHYYQKALFSADQESALKEIRALGDEKESEEKESTSTTSIVDRNYKVDLLTNCVGIYDHEGSPTTFLETGSDYVLSLNVTFQRDFEKIKVKFLAEDVTGKTISTFDSYSDNNLIENVKYLDKYSIVNNFKCDVFQGHYTVYVKFFDISDARFDSELIASEIGVRFEAGVVGKDNNIKIGKIKV
ncbi:ABC transporter ATP-binding protein [Francisella philomiragia]|uniref:ABC transporter ATP-binding protein n=1 Tax=Francisella philomiragia TaxID=28110 RepID=UPI003513C70C